MIDIYKAYSFKDYSWSTFCEWRFPNIRIRDMTQVDRYILPNVGELTSLSKGFNAFTTYCDQFLNEHGLSILKGLGYATYMYQGGVLQRLDDDYTCFHVVFRIPGYTCGGIIIRDKKIIDIGLNDIAYTGILANYREELATDIKRWIGEEYKVDELREIIPWKMLSSYPYIQAQNNI